MSGDPGWSAETPLAALRAALDTLGTASADRIAALVRPLLADAGWLDTLIAGLSRRSLADPGREPPVGPLAGAMQAGLLLHHDARVTLFAGVGHRDALAAKRMRPRDGAIVFTGRLTLIRVLRAGGAVLSFWRGGWRDGAIVQVCEFAGRRRLTDGEVIAIDGRDTAWLVEHARCDFAWLQAVIEADAAPTASEYDRATGALIGQSAARDESSRRQMLATLLAELDVADADAFDAASRIAEPFARWHILRCWLAIDSDAAVPRLREMAARDPDAELRGLAAHTLGMVLCLA